MTQYNRPNETVFASGAKPGELESFPDIARGWGIAFDQTDGIPPMEWFNALFKRNDEAVRYLLQKGISEWSPTEDYTIGAHVQESEKVWKAKVSSSGKRPSQTPSDWVETALTRDALIMLIQEQLGGIGVKVRVRAASTANLSLNGLQFLDGVSLVQGDRVLVKNQVQEQSNGIYVATASEWLRSSDADTNEKVQPGFMVHIESGATQGNSIWQLITDGPVTLGASALGFEMVSGYTGVAAGTYRSLTVDRYGRVIAGANPGTLAGYGITIATQADAEAPDGAADNVKPMTALRVFQTITKRVVQATESLLGVAKIATQGQVNAGEDDAVIVTPKKLRFGFSLNASMNGYIAFPTWLGGMLIQWGTAGNIPAGGVASISYPMVFPNAARCVLSVPTDDNSYNVIPMSITTAGFNLRNKNTIASTSSNWLAVGF